MLTGIGFFLMFKDKNVSDRALQSLIQLIKRKEYSHYIIMMVESIENINAKNDEGETALLIAASHLRYDIVSLLLENGADATVIDQYGNNALARAFFGYIELPRRDDVGIEWEIEDCYNIQRLSELAKLLINKGADINNASGEGGSLLIHAIQSRISSFFGVPKVAFMAIKLGVNINAQNHQTIDEVSGLSAKARSALIDAAQIGNKDIVELLLAAGADPNLQDENGHTALMLAMIQDIGFHTDENFYNYGEIIQLLINYKADINIRDNEGNTALIILLEDPKVRDFICLFEVGDGEYDEPKCIAFAKYVLKTVHTIINKGGNTYLEIQEREKALLKLEAHPILKSRREEYNELKSMLEGNLRKIELSTNEFIYKNLFLKPNTASGTGEIVFSIENLVKEILSFLPLLEKKSLEEKTITEGSNRIEQIENEGFIIQDVLGDGNCFFRAIASALGIDQNQHMALRATAIEQIINNPDLYRQWVGDINHYVDNVIDHGAWVDDTTIIQALADAREININITPLYGINNILINAANGNGLQTIRLIYTGNHYQAVLPSQDLEVGRKRLVDEEAPSDKTLHKKLKTSLNDDDDIIKALESEQFISNVESFSNDQYIFNMAEIDPVNEYFILSGIALLAFSSYQ